LSKAIKIILQLLFNENIELEKATTKTKILPKAGKSIFNYFLMKISGFEKATTKTKIMPKARKSNFSIAFQIDFFLKKQPPKPRSCQKLE